MTAQQTVQERQPDDHLVRMVERLSAIVTAETQQLRDRRFTALQSLIDRKNRAIYELQVAIPDTQGAAGTALGKALRNLRDVLGENEMVLRANIESIDGALSMIGEFEKHVRTDTTYDDPARNGGSI